MWENYNVLRQRFPDFKLDEGALSQGGANVTPSSPPVTREEKADSEALPVVPGDENDQGSRAGSVE